MRSVPINSCEIGIKSTRLAKMDPMASGRWKPILKTDSHLVKDIGSSKYIQLRSKVLLILLLMLATTFAIRRQT